MTTLAARSWDMLRLIRHGGPGICNIAITNSCNATCDFCNFAYNKGTVGPIRWLDADRFPDALDILHGRGIRYLNLFGGEPLLHPALTGLIAEAVKRNMAPAVITNGWLLPARLQQLADAGLKTVYISIDSARMDVHENNRGLRGLGERIRAATKEMPKLGIAVVAQVTMNKLIDDYRSLVPMLRDLGFDAVTFSYPQKAKLGSSSLAWSDSSQLVNFSKEEMVAAFDGVNDLRKFVAVNNPRASIADMKKHAQGEPETFGCYGGFKSFYMDWNFDMWRCDAWQERMCSVWEFASTPLVRDECTACIADCYRDSSVMLHFAVSLGDAMDHLQQGRLLAALKTVANTRNLKSLGAIGENFRVLSRLARTGAS
jgi:MoaA/NifB/PqqE/SkfB family radical SAM enzyme